MKDIAHYQSALDIWERMTKGGFQSKTQLELDISKKINSIFHVGDYYSYIFDVSTGQFLFIDAAIDDILGAGIVTMKDIAAPDFLSLIHPEDILYFLNFEQKVSEFFGQLEIHQLMKYKVSYDFRIKRADGIYIRILQQVLTIHHSDEGHVLQTLGIHTDITHIKESGEPKLSFIGLEGEPSFINVDYNKKFAYTKDIFSKREKEIIQTLCEGNSNEMIAQLLSISVHTVRTHRKNILRKADVKSTSELIALSIRQGWI